MKRILVALTALVLTIGLIGAGTVAYFQDTVNSNVNQFTTGTLTMDISKDNVNFAHPTVNSVWQSPAGWAPGKDFTSTVYIRNTGTMDIQVLGTDWHHPTGSGWDTVVGDKNLADWIQVTELKENIPGVGWYDDLPNFASVDTNGDNVISLRELMTAYFEGGKGISGGSGPSCTSPLKPDEFGQCVTHLADSAIGVNGAPAGDPPAILAGSTLQMKLTFKLDPNTPNDFQGKQLLLDMTHVGTQVGTDLP